MPRCSSWIHGVAAQLAITRVTGQNDNSAYFFGHIATDPLVENRAGSSPSSKEMQESMIFQKWC